MGDDELTREEVIQDTRCEDLFNFDDDVGTRCEDPDHEFRVIGQPERVPPTIREMQDPFFVSDHPEDAQRYCRAMERGFAYDPFEKY